MYFVFLQNFAIHNMPLFGESWSLSIEEWFYLLFPVLIIFATYISTDKKRVILYFCIFMFLLFPGIIKGIKFTEIKDINDYSWDKEFRRLVMLPLDSIAFGILGAYLSFYYQYNWIEYKEKHCISDSLLCYWLLL